MHKYQLQLNARTNEYKTTYKETNTVAHAYTYIPQQTHVNLVSCLAGPKLSIKYYYIRCKQLTPGAVTTYLDLGVSCYNFFDFPYYEISQEC